MSERNYDIVCVTESWLSDSILSSELFPACYTVLRCDRRFDRVGRSRGGGVLLAMLDTIKFTCVDTSLLSDTVPLIDVIICKCINPVELVICAVYIPPDVPSDDLELFLGLLDVYLINANVIFLGDFNAPNFIFDNSTCTKSTMLHNLCHMLDLQQSNNILNINNKLLDLVFASVNVRTSVSTTNQVLVPEDMYHPALEVTIDIDTCVQPPNFPSATSSRFDFHRVDYDVLCSALSIEDWSWIGELTDVNLTLDVFYDQLNSVFERYVPKHRSIQYNSIFPIWFSSEIKKNIKMKDYYRTKWLSTGNQYYHNEYKRLRHLIKGQISQAHTVYINNVEHSLKTDISLLWKYVNQKRGGTRIPGILYDGDTLLDTPQLIVDSFAELFSRTFIVDTSSPDRVSFSYLPCITLASVTEEKVLSVMSELTLKYTSGHDSIPACLIQRCRQELAKPMSMLINLSLKCNVFPEKWKKSRIVPVFKKGNSNLLENYRPISLLCNFAKIYEQILFECVSSAVRPYLSPLQHGFIPGRSTITNLATISQYLSEHLDNRGQVDVVYTDLSRAFDTISHPILLGKLNYFGFSTPLLNLMSSYVTDRSGYVYYNGFISNEIYMTSGVPQGSNLGPLLFILYINDLLSSLSCPALAYADDLKIYSSISTSLDIEILQRNLDLITEWCDLNKLKLNVSKCCKVTYTRRSMPTVGNYHLNDTPLMSKDLVSDLGILFDSALTFVPHINELSKSASKALGFVIRTCREFNDTTLLKRLYFAFVMSKLEYGSIIWCPIYSCHSLNLERIQRRFFKFVWFKKYGTYPERGADLGQISSMLHMDPLCERREFHSATFLVKLLRNKIDCSYLLSKIPINVPRPAARQSLNFLPPAARTNIMARAPINIMCRSANKLLSDVFI